MRLAAIYGQSRDQDLRPELQQTAFGIELKRSVTVLAKGAKRPIADQNCALPLRRRTGGNLQVPNHSRDVFEQVVIYAIEAFEP